MKRRNAFTLVELLVVVSILSLLVTILAPTLGRVREMTKRAVCGTNLSAAAKGMNMYAAEYGGRFPTCGYSGGRFDVIGDNPSGNPSSANSNSRNLFLAVRLGFVEPTALVCPATRNEPASREKGSTNYYDFASYNNCSYSYHLQFDSGSGSKGYPLTMMSSSEMALLADKNPFVKYPGSSNTQANVEIPTGVDPATKQGNSMNHGADEDGDGVGQNVAFKNGNVSWFDKPTAGPGNDNVYTVWDGDDKSGGQISPSSMPMGKLDSFLAP